MASNSRRAAGTQTFTDVLKIWSGIKRPDSEQDLADFGAGVTLEVSCFLRPLESPASRFQLGMLRLVHGEPVTWRRKGGKDVVSFDPPLTMDGSREQPKGPNFMAFTVVSASGAFSLQVPSPDTRLVGMALGEHVEPDDVVE